jgi:hypothetical protein
MNGQPSYPQAYKRAMSAEEHKSVDKVYKNAQKQARPLGFFALVFAAIGIVTGAGTLDLSTSKGMTTIMIIVVGIGAFLYSGYMLRLRRKISDSHRSEQVIVVRGTVTRYNGRGNSSAFTVGPLTFGLEKRMLNALPEGSVADIACVPKLGVLVSINGMGQEHPAKLTIPVGLEASALPIESAYPVQPAATAERGQTYSPQATSFCFSCGNPSSGLAFCSNCGTKL